MENLHEHIATIVALLKILGAWAAVAVSAIAFTKLLSAVASVSAIVFTWLQIYKLLRELRKKG